MGNSPESRKRIDWSKRIDIEVIPAILKGGVI